VYISLSARDRNPQIRIHARAESEIGLKHLQLAGADRAISSYQWSAMRIANAIARPSVIDFLNLILPGQAGEPFSVEEVRVPARSASTDKTIAMLEDENDRVRIVALKRGDAPIQLVPGPRMQIEAGDLLIAIGERTGDVRKLVEIEVAANLSPMEYRGAVRGGSRREKDWQEQGRRANEAAAVFAAERVRARSTLGHGDLFGSCVRGRSAGRGA
jgi:uncharacterized protein with PhoU and TrkA domain